MKLLEPPPTDERRLKLEMLESMGGPRGDRGMVVAAADGVARESGRAGVTSRT